jgi:hypothetical protein
MEEEPKRMFFRNRLSRESGDFRTGAGVSAMRMSIDVSRR